MKDLLRLKVLLPLAAIYIISATLLTFILPMTVSGPGVEGYDCGPTALCMGAKNPHAEWFAGTQLLKGDFEIGTQSWGRATVTVEQTDLNRTIVFAAVLALLPTMLALIAYARKNNRTKR